MLRRMDDELLLRMRATLTPRQFIVGAHGAASTTTNSGNAMSAATTDDAFEDDGC